MDAGDPRADAATDGEVPPVCDATAPQCVCPKDPTPGGPCPAPSCPVAQCPPEEACRFAEFNAHGYFFCSQKRGWEQMSELCMAAGLLPVAVGSSDEDNFILDNVDGNTWLGASDREAEGVWRWADGTIFRKAGSPQHGAYQNWTLLEPNNVGLAPGSQGDCLALWYSMTTWNDDNCSDMHGYVCETP